MHYFATAPLLLADMTAWLTPIWLFGFGCLLGLVALALLFGLLKLLAPRIAEIAWGTLREGVVFPVLCLVSGFAAFALISLLLSLAGVGYLPLADISRSLARLPYSNSFSKDILIPAVPPQERTGKPQEHPLEYRPQEMRSVELRADRGLTVELRDAMSYSPGALAEKISLEPNLPWSWPNAKDTARTQSLNPFSGRRATLYVLNPNDEAVTLHVSGTTREEFPEVAAVLYTATGVVGVILVYFLMRLAMPKVMAVASVTSKEAVAQPLYQVVLAIGAFMLIAFIFIPYNTFGEDVKMLKMGALELIMVLAILVAAWTASVGVSEEIEGRTALTVLSKPIGRIQFLLGKFLGVVQAVSLLYLFLGAVFLITVSGKVVYDVRESVLPEASWTDCYAEIAGIVPGLTLAFFETIVLTSISVAVSTRLPMLPNLLICFSVYALGNLAPLLVQAKVNDPYGIVHFVGQLMATVLPVLENFNVQAPISAGRDVPLAYLGWALIYCLLYSTIAMLVALVLFEDRDLA
jgi:ABC-type transport system involved in multi-copper enzyme maturation permease subunit